MESNVVMVTPLDAAKRMSNGRLAGWAKMMRSGETPASSANWISAAEAQSKPQPFAASTSIRAGIGEHFIA